MNLPPHLDAMLLSDGDEHPSYGHASRTQRGHVKGTCHSLPELVKVELEKTALGKRCTLTLDPEPHALNIAHILEATNWPRVG